MFSLFLVSSLTTGYGYETLAAMTKIRQIRPNVTGVCLYSVKRNRSPVDGDKRTVRIEPRISFPDASVDQTEAG
jgi:hypothetical protein